MNDLIDRYVHQVGLYVRPKERAEIEAELRSQIQDQLDDRYGSAPTPADVAAVLKQFGSPRTMAVSYSGEQYLVGPELYPYMMTVLRFGLPLVPALVVIANIIGAALSPEGANWIGLLIGSVITGVQAALLFLAVVVIFFAILQHSDEVLRASQTEFNPLELPAVEDPGAVDRLESGVGIAIGMLFGIAILYYIQVGGLTLRFNLSDPGEVLPVPTLWLVVLLFTTFASIFLNLWALLFRRRWTFWTWLLETALELLGAVGLYFALFTPVAERIKATVPNPTWLPLDQLPWIITLVTIAILVLGNGGKLIRLWQAQGERTKN
ncbi:MAG: hypothetical protein L6Q98_22105 [Anaerolineae bacterium]|nr:hypothetical protein [Anaerolineae bacterium]NUQ05418.1 hypothetical protein [Anaerolineae bacterium]